MRAATLTSVSVTCVCIDPARSALQGWGWGLLGNSIRQITIHQPIHFTAIFLGNIKVLLSASKIVQRLADLKEHDALGNRVQSTARGFWHSAAEEPYRTRWKSDIRRSATADHCDSRDVKKKSCLESTAGVPTELYVNVKGAWRLELDGLKKC